jgi:hypothetical protein
VTLGVRPLLVMPAKAAQVREFPTGRGKFPFEPRIDPVNGKKSLFCQLLEHLFGPFPKAPSRGWGNFNGLPARRAAGAPPTAPRPSPCDTPPPWLQVSTPQSGRQDGSRSAKGRRSGFSNWITAVSGAGACIRLFLRAVEQHPDAKVFRHILEAMRHVCGAE